MVFKKGNQKWKLRKKDFNGKNNPFYGKTHTDEARKKIGKSSRKRKTWKKWGKDTRVKIGQNEEEHPAWKGDKVGYSAVHTWVRKHKPKPKLCVRCGKKKATLLHNVDGKYKRDIEDYQWLCNKCHLIIHGLIGEN